MKPKLAKAKSSTPLWPRLGYLQAGALDYCAAQYDAAWLQRAAQLIEASGELGALRNSVASCLRHLAETPAALKPMNATLKRAPQSLRGLNVALHYLVCKKLRTPAARKQVAKAWKISDETVKTASRQYGGAAAVELCWHLQAKPELSEGDTLTLLHADLCDRAKFVWLKIRKSVKKQRRGKVRKKT